MMQLWTVPCTALLFAVCIFAPGGVIASSTDHLEPTGYMYKDNSLVRPYLSSGITIPHWDFSGSAVVSDEFVRLTPDRQSKRGVLVNKYPMTARHWEATIHFHVHGQGKTLFGDGWAFWLTKDGQRVGPTFGGMENFVGLGVFFDTYSNSQTHNQGRPYVSAIVSDGSITYFHDESGTDHEIGGCQSFFRGVDHETYVRVTYRLRRLTVAMEVDGKGWKECFSVPDVIIPTTYKLAVTAATGDLADNHDILSIKLAEPKPLTIEEAQLDQEYRASEVKAAQDFVADASKPDPSQPSVKEKPIDYNVKSKTKRNVKRERSGKSGSSILWVLGLVSLGVIVIVVIVFFAYSTMQNKKKAHHFT